MSEYIDYTLNDLDKLIKKLHKEKMEQDKEIERLNKELDKYRYTPKAHFKETMELRDRINKAIEYIEENCGADNRLQLKIILQGSDKE